MTEPFTVSNAIAGGSGMGDIRGRSLWNDAMARFRRHRAAMVSVWILGIVTILAVLVPEFWPNSLDEVNWDYIQSPPTTENNLWFGTDVNGRDMFSRTFYGARISLTIGVLTTLVALIIGVVYGAIAGYQGGAVGDVMMRVVDVLYSLPTLFFIIILVTIFGSNFLLIFISIGAVEWLTLARIVRGQTLSIKEKEYVESALAGRPVHSHDLAQIHYSQRNRTGNRLCDLADTHQYHRRELPEFSRPRRAGTLYQLGAIDLAGCG